MYKYLLIAFLLLSISAKSQVNQTEAKAAYLLAEESYAKSDYKATIRYLEQAKASLGAANSKILYLQIQCETEIGKGTPEAAEKILALIQEFEKSPDIADFNEEKKLEVTKTKLALKNQLADITLARKNVLERARLDTMAIATFEKFARYQLGDTFEEVKGKFPDFAEALNRKAFKKDSVKKFKDGDIQYGMGKFSLRFNRLKKLVGIFYSNTFFHNTGDINYVKGKAANDLLKDELMKKYGPFIPMVANSANGSPYVHVEYYSWKVGNKELSWKTTFFDNTSDGYLSFYSHSD